eukprot:symbB.v1.2.031672.t1/scaffold3702.1/size55254/3
MLGRPELRRPLNRKRCELHFCSGGRWLAVLITFVAAQEKESADVLFSRLDTDSDGLLSKTEMGAWIKKEDDAMSTGDVDEEATVALEVFDHDKDDALNKEEFKEALKTMEEEDLGDHEVEADEIAEEWREHEH